MFEPGSVVVIPFPYSDLSANKKRPALVLTPPDALGDFLAMPLTSQPQELPAYRLEAGPLPESGTLPLTSWVKPHTVYTLHHSQVLKVLGQVGEDVRRECVRRLCQHLQPEH